MAEAPAPPEGTSGYQDIPDDQRRKAQTFFARGKTVADTGQFEYSIEMYLQGLKIDPEAVKKGAVPALIDALKDPDAEMYRIAVSALAQIGVTAVPALSDALKDPELK